MAARDHVATGETIPSALVTIQDRVYQDKASGKWQVRWQLRGKQASKLCPSKKSATEFRKELDRAVDRGERFDLGSRLPVSMSPPPKRYSPLDIARDLLSAKWSRNKPRTRDDLMRSTALVLWAMVDEVKRPARREALTYVRTTLPKKPIEAIQADLDALPAEVQQAGHQLVTNLPDISDLTDRVKLRGVLHTITHREDGVTPYADGPLKRNWGALNQLLEHASYLEYIDSNPLSKKDPHIQRPETIIREVSDREVVSRAAGLAILELCAADAHLEPHKVRTDRYTAYFGLIFHVGLRPTELDALRWEDLTLPAEGWGKARPRRSEARSTAAANDGSTSYTGPLKWRKDGTVRTVPLPRSAVRLLLHHRRYTGPKGRVFASTTGTRIDRGTVSDVWCPLRKAVLLTKGSPHWIGKDIEEDEENKEAFELALKQHPLYDLVPYDLRHYCATAWLNADVPPIHVADRLGHSISVLHSTYAGWIRGLEDAHNQQIDAYTGEGEP